MLFCIVLVMVPLAELVNCAMRRMNFQVTSISG